MGLRKLSPGGHEYLVRAVACGDRQLEPGELLSDYYLASGYPAGEWFGQGAAELGMTGEVTAAQLSALFGEGRHPDADRIESEAIANGASPDQATKATLLGRRFPRYGKDDELRDKVTTAYKQHNRDRGRPVATPIKEETRASLRHEVLVQEYRAAHRGEDPGDERDLSVGCGGTSGS